MGGWQCGGVCGRGGEPRKHLFKSFSTLLHRNNGAGLPFLQTEFTTSNMNQKIKKNLGMSQILWFQFIGGFQFIEGDRIRPFFRLLKKSGFFIHYVQPNKEQRISSSGWRCGSRQFALECAQLGEASPKNRRKLKGLFQC